MRDLVVRQPHLGRESIVLLGRIVDRQDDGVAQDDIEPYLLVRLLRCGYIRRQQSRGSNFIATPAGIERWRLEAMAAQQRQDDLDRREIIRGRLQTMAARLELDYPAALPPPALRDFGLPQIYQCERPALHTPELPAIHVAGLRAACQGRRRIAGPEPIALARDAGPRITPEAALSLIREGEQRAQRESRLPVTIAGELLPPEGDVAVEHVGRLPAKRDAGVPAVREDSVPAVGEASAPVVREDGVPVVREDTVPAILLAALVDEQLETPEAPDEAALHDDAPQAEWAEPGGSGWRRAAVVAAVATVALLAAHPAYRYLSAPVEAPPTAPIAPASVPTRPTLPVANAVASNTVATIPRAAQIRNVADRMPPAPIAADKPAQATVDASAPVVVIPPTPAAVIAPRPAAVIAPQSLAVIAPPPAGVKSPGPAVIASAPAVTGPVPAAVTAAEPSVIAPAPAAVVAAASAEVIALSRSPRDPSPKPDSDQSRSLPGPALVATAHEPDIVRADQAPESDLRPDPAKSVPSTTTAAASSVTTSIAVSAAATARPPAEPPQTSMTNVGPTPVVATRPAAPMPPPGVPSPSSQRRQSWPRRLPGHQRRRLLRHQSQWPSRWQPHRLSHRRHRQCCPLRRKRRSRRSLGCWLHRRPQRHRRR